MRGSTMKTYLVEVSVRYGHCMYAGDAIWHKCILNTYVDFSIAHEDSEPSEEVERLAEENGWLETEEPVIGEIEIDDWKYTDMSGVETNWTPGARERQAAEERAWRQQCEQLKDQWMAHYNKMVKKGIQPSEIWGPIFAPVGFAGPAEGGGQ